jgi:hypothetical protein
LERNPQTDAREEWGPLRHHIAVPEPRFVQEMQQVAQGRFGEALDRLTPQARVAIEEAVSDPARWSTQPTYHGEGCPACTEPMRSDDATTP